MEEELQEFGLSKKESVILNCLINSRVPLSGNEIAKKTGVTRYYAYEVLHRLQERGFIEFLPGRPKRYAFDSTLLAEIIEQEERKINRDWQLRKARLHEIAERIQSIEPSAERVAGEYVTLWKGPQVSARVDHLITGAQEILLLRTYPITAQDEFFELWKPIQTLVQKGGRGRVLLGSTNAESLIALKSIESELSQLISLHSACPIRVSNTELVGFDIIDSKMTLEFLSPTTADIRLVIREADAVQAKIALFDSLWERAQDFRILAYAGCEDPTIERSLQESPPHIPLPNFQESGVHRFPSRMEAIKALQKIMIDSAKNEIIFANLESIPVDEELRYAVDEILKALSLSHKKDVNWRVLWKPHPEIDEDVLTAFLDTLRSIPSLEIRFWEGSLDLGTFFLIDNSILLIPVFPLEHYENAILVTRNPIIKHLVVRGFNQLWSLSPQSELETRF